MTAFDILVPLMAIVFALGAAWVARQATKRFDEKHGHHHPAE
jgi:hypothetical protein